MLTGGWKHRDDIPKESLLLQFDFPRFRAGNFEINRQLSHEVEEMAKQKGCSSAQLAINWTRMLSKCPGMPLIVPIPGCTTVARIVENSKIVDLTDEEMAQIDQMLSNFTPAGTRYP
jgi:pyridoxine 4-dehydrogenase